MLGKLFLLSVFVAPFLFLGVDAQQYFHVYRQSGCASPIQNFTTNGTLTVANGTTLYYRINGLWGIRGCNNSVCGITDVRAGSTTTPCSSLGVSSNSTMWFLTRYGDPAQNENKFVYFTENNFEGIRGEAETTGNNNTNGATVRSYYFFGRSSWQLFTGTNFTGTYDCLNHTGTLPMRYDTSYNRPTGSIRHGCTANPGTTTLGTTTTPTGTTTRTTTTTTRPTNTTTRPTVTTPRPTGNTTRHSNAPKISVSVFTYLITVLYSIKVFFQLIISK